MTHAPWLAVQLQWMRASGVQRVAFFCTVLGLAGVLTGSLIKRDASNVESALMRARQERAERIAHEQAVVPTQSTAERARASVSAFRTVVGRASNLERDLQTIFETARDQGLTLPEGRYKVADSRAGEFQTCEIDLPVKDSYRAIRRFAEAVLLKLPHAALEDVRFKRKSAGTAELEAQLRFVLYLDNVERLARPNASRVAATEIAR